MGAVEKIILGTVQMGLPYGIQGAGALDLDQSKKIFKKAYTAGVRFLDTAEVYGKAHQVIGNFHSSTKMKFEIITKLPNVLDRDIGFKVDQYLQELKVEKIETLMFHSFDAYEKNSKVLKELKNLKKFGLINKIGVSIYTNEQLEKVIENEMIDLIQLPFNLLDNYSLRGELLKRAKKCGKIVHTRSAFLQGLFFMDVDSENRVIRKLRPQLQLLKRIAEKEGRDMASLALNYALQQESIDNVLIGVDSIDQLEKNLSIIGDPLPENSLEEINKIIIRDQNLLNPSLWN